MRIFLYIYYQFICVSVVCMYKGILFECLYVFHGNQMLLVSSFAVGVKMRRQAGRQADGWHALQSSLHQPARLFVVPLSLLL